MEKVARKFSRHMEGMEYLVHSGPPPPRLLAAPDSAGVEDDEGSGGSSASSNLSEPFSEYAPLEAPPAAGLHGQLAKFSAHFQHTMRDMQTMQATATTLVVPAPTKRFSLAASLSKLKPVKAKESAVVWQPQVSDTDIELDVPEELLLPPSDDPSSAAVQSHEEKSGMWRMLEQYDSFTLSLGGASGSSALGRAPHCLDQAPAHPGTREEALGKCAAWLEQQPPSPPPRVRLQPYESQNTKWN